MGSCSALHHVVEKVAQRLPWLHTALPRWLGRV
jgi:hypothetical protein